MSEPTGRHRRRAVPPDDAGADGTAAAPGTPGRKPAVPKAAPKAAASKSAAATKASMTKAKRKVVGAAAPIRNPSIWTGDAPTEPIQMRDLLKRTPYRNPRSTQAATAHREARDALDLALRVGEVMFRCGAGAPQVESSIIAVTEAAGLQRLELDITNQSLIAQCQTEDGGRVTLVRVVRSSRRDFARLAAIHDLVDAIVDEGFDLERARHQLRVISTTRRVFPRWAETVALGVMAGAIALLLGAGPSVAILAAIAALIALFASGRAARWLPEFYTNAAGAAGAVLLAFLAFWAALYLPLSVSAADFAYIVAGGIVVLLPGRTMASAFEDVLYGYPITGAGRMFAVFLSLTGIIIGVGAGLTAALWITDGFHLDLSTPEILQLRSIDAPIVPALIGAFFTGVTGAVSLQTRRRMVLPSGLLAVLATAVLLLSGQVGLGSITGTGLAGVVIGFVGRLVALQLGAPPMVLVHPGTYALMPGLAIFRGLYDMVVNVRADSGSLSLQTGITTLLGALAMLLAIAVGTTLGDHLAALLDDDIVQTRRRGRARTG